MTSHNGDLQNLADVRRVFDRWINAVQHRNLDGVVEQHSSDIVMFDVPEAPPIRGLDAYRECWAPFLEWLGPRGVFEPSEIQIIAGDTVAFSHCLVRCIGSTRSESPEQPVRLTLGYRKIGGEWLIAHEHHSVGYLMEK
jgi:uncharacterized protein (TIGR02246 family)